MPQRPSRRTKKKPRQRPSPPRQRSGDYRIFVGAFPQGDIVDEIQAVREQYDGKTAVITAPHMTLAGTYWRTGPATAKNEQSVIMQLERACEQIRPFDLILGGIQSFGNRVVYLGVKPSNEILDVRQRLTRVIGRDKHRRFRPHLTLAMRLNEPDTQQMITELKESQWQDERYTLPIQQLYLMQRGAGDAAWRRIAEFALDV